MNVTVFCASVYKVRLSTLRGRSIYPRNLDDDKKYWCAVNFNALQPSLWQKGTPVGTEHRAWC